MKNSNAKVHRIEATNLERPAWAAQQQPRNLRQLRQAVILACQSRFIDAQMIQSVFSGMVNRARRCIGVQGHAFSDE
jgi:hypothetical protein